MGFKDKNYLERNKIIAIRALKGESFASLAREYKLSRETIRVILWKASRLAIPDIVNEPRMKMQNHREKHRGHLMPPRIKENRL